MTASRLQRPGQARLLSRHHRPLHGMPHADGTSGRISRLGKGGDEFKGPGACQCRATSPRTRKGIGGWTDAEIKGAITQGVRKDGSKLKPPMGFALYATMTDADLERSSPICARCRRLTRWQTLRAALE